LGAAGDPTICDYVSALQQSADMTKPRRTACASARTEPRPRLARQARRNGRGDCDRSPTWPSEKSQARCGRFSVENCLAEAKAIAL